MLAALSGLTEWTPPDPTRPARSQRLGASEVAGAMGLSQYKDNHPLAIWARKVGLDGEKKDNPAMAWGRKLEDVVLAAYEEETGRSVVRASRRLTYRSRDRHWLTATPDSMCLAAPVGVEAKTAGLYPGQNLKEIWDAWGKPGTAEIPQDYQAQAQCQMHVCELEAVDVPALIGGRGFVIYTVPRDDRFIANMLNSLDAFWQMVRERRRPDPDWSHPDTPRLIGLMARPREGVVRKLDSAVAPLLNFYLHSTESERRVKKFRAQAKAKLEDALGDADRGELPDGRVVVRSTGARRTIRVIDPKGIVVGSEGEVEE